MPYVIQPPSDRRERFAAGESIDMRLVLVGEGRAWLPWVIWTLGRMGWQGMGWGRVAWDLVNVDALGPRGESVPLLDTFDYCPTALGSDLLAEAPDFESCRIQFQTPTSIKDGGRIVDRLDGALLVRRLVRRLGELCERYCGLEPRPATIAPGRDRRCDPHAVSRTAPGTLGALQQSHSDAPSDGRPGRRAGAGRHPPDLRPLLVLGTYVNVGKSASFGMGCYRLTQIP